MEIKAVEMGVKNLGF